jgi:ATP-dependent Clp protease ATP-binding subunit ClpC
MIGFNRTQDDVSKNKEDIINKEIKKHFPPEFLSRINSIINFKQLNDDNFKQIIKNKLNGLNKKLHNNANIQINYDKNVVEYIFTKINKDSGARMISNVIEDEVENKLIDMIINVIVDDVSEYKFKISINRKNELNIKYLL